MYNLIKDILNLNRTEDTVVEVSDGAEDTREVYNLIKDILNLNWTEDTVVDR